MAEQFEFVCMFGTIPNVLSHAFPRSCRLLPVPPPDNFGRAAIFGVHTRAMPLAPDVSLELLAQQTTGFTGADIAACCQDAALAALEEDINARFVKMSHFVKAVDGQHKRLVLSGCTY